MNAPLEKELINEIKRKKELSGLANQIVAQSLQSYLHKHKIDLKMISKKQSKLIVKDIRAELRLLSGRFQKSFKSKTSFLDSDSIEELLKTHSSTSERLEFYPKLRKIIASLKISSVLDLGCGLNPLALASRKVRYSASDINEDELSLISQFFNKNKINGNIFIYDLRNIKADLPKADLCLLFKVLDVVDPASAKRGKLTKKILLSVPCKKILVSFSTKKLSGKPMNFPKRTWFEKLLKSPGYQYVCFKTSNEIFYLITKPN